MSVTEPTEAHKNGYHCHLVSSYGGPEDNPYLSTLQPIQWREWLDGWYEREYS